MTIKFFATATLALLGLGAIAPVAHAKPEALFAQQAAPQIDSFTVSSVDRLTPGNELVFTLQGTPGARATFTVGNAASNLPMQEVEPGVYEGRYTIRTQDQLSQDTVVRANLAQGDQISSVRLQDGLVANSDTTNPQNGQTLAIDSFTANSVSDLTPGTPVTFTLNGTPNANASFSINGVATEQPMEEIRPGVYRGEYVIRRQDAFPSGTLNATARLESAGETVRAQLDQNSVANSQNPSASSAQLPLEIISPANNASVDGTIQVQGRSAPETTIDINVKATNSLAGIVGINRDVLSRSIQTDAQGNFNFEFEPLVDIAGTRYEISLDATNGDRTNQETLVLIQQ